MKDAVGIGALNLDLIYQVSSLSLGDRAFKPGAETFGTSRQLSELIPKLGQRGELRGCSGGGSAANTIYALARMGFATGFVGVVGEDEGADIILKGMKGVDLQRVRRQGESGVCLSLIAEEDRALMVCPNANDRLVINEHDIEYVNRFRLVHMSSLVADEGLRQQVKAAKRLSDQTILSFAPGELYARRGRKALRSLLERSDVLFVNEREVWHLTGKKDELEAVEELHEEGVSTVACTLGGKGSLVMTEQGLIKVPAIKAEVVDKTGGGDVYAAGFLAGMLLEWKPRDCACFGAKVAAKSIGGVGRSAYPEERDVQDHLREMKGRRKEC